MHLPRGMRVRTVRRFFQMEEGVAAVEFALIAPVLIFLMMAIIEISLILFAQGMMETATFNASRLGKTGYIPVGMTRQQAILQMVHNKTVGLLDDTKLSITSKAYTDFSQIEQPEPFTDSNHNGAHDLGELYSDVNGNGQVGSPGTELEFAL